MGTGGKTFAVEVEDHPIDYADFEGIIPEGQYGGGTVMVWDRGTYELAPPGDPVEAVRKGKLHVILHGEKAKGEWAPIRIRAEGGKNQWLLMKTAGGVKPISKKRDDQSVKTGRTMKQIASARDAEWQSNRVDKKDSFKGRIAKVARDASLKKKEQNKIVGQAPSLAEIKKWQPERPPYNSSIRPPRKFILIGFAQSATALRRADEAAVWWSTRHQHGDWIYELKFDGIRAIAIKGEDRVQLVSRNGKELRSLS